MKYSISEDGHSPGKLRIIKSFRATSIVQLARK